MLGSSSPPLNKTRDEKQKQRHDTISHFINASHLFLGSYNTHQRSILSLIPVLYALPLPRSRSYPSPAALLHWPCSLDRHGLSHLKIESIINKIKGPDPNDRIKTLLRSWLIFLTCSESTNATAFDFLSFIFPVSRVVNATLIMSCG
jgi:hypothetical protein